MAFFTTKTGEVVQQEITNNVSVKGAQAELIFIPFSVPWYTTGLEPKETFLLGESTYAYIVANKIAPRVRPWWIGAPNISDMKSYYPYGLAPPLAAATSGESGISTGIVDQQSVSTEGTNNGEFIEPVLGNVDGGREDYIRTYFGSKFVDSRGCEDAYSVTTTEGSNVFMTHFGSVDTPYQCYGKLNDSPGIFIRTAQGNITTNAWIDDMKTFGPFINPDIGGWMDYSDSDAASKVAAAKISGGTHNEKITIEAPWTPGYGEGPVWNPFKDFYGIMTFHHHYNKPGETGVEGTTTLEDFWWETNGTWDQGATILPGDHISSLFNKSFRDATFSIKKPFVEIAYGESLGEKIGISDPVKVKAHYNFYLQPYETVANTTKITTNTTAGEVVLPEVVLPNIYTLISDLAKGSDINAQYQYADQWAPLSVEPAADVIKKWNSKGSREYFNSIGIHLENLANAENAADTNLGIQIDTKRYYTTGIASDRIKDFMDEADKTKKYFPMYVDIEVPAANQGKIGAALYKAGLTDQFMQTTMAAMFPRPYYNAGNNNEPSFFRKTLIIKKDSFIKDDPEEGLYMTGWQDSLYEEPLIKLWLNDIFIPKGAQAPPTDLDSINTTPTSVPDNIKNWYITDDDPAGFMNKLNNQIGNSPFIRPVVIGKKKGSPVKFINNIKWLAARKKIKKIIDEKVRSVKEIYDGKLAYSEVLFYEVVKFRSNKDENGIVKEAGGTFVQNIFLPNVPGMEVLKYVDTQVKYGEEYYYQVYAHTFVIGTQYQYSKDPVLVIDNYYGTFIEKLSLEYNFAPTVYLMRVPYYNTYVTMGNTTIEEGNPVIENVWNWDPSKLERTPIHDMPPVFPDITFLPLYGERNKLLINANFNAGEYELGPVFIEKEEKTNLDKIRRNQKKMEPEPINFKSDDFCGQIEILRIDEKPTSYAAFGPVANHRVAILGGSSAFGFIDDTLKPNKDYYYIGRAKDVHRNYSNPSPVYHIRIEAREGEAPYTIFKMFFIEEVKEKKTMIQKKLMKYIRIQPAFKQSYLDDASLIEKESSAEGVTSKILQQFIGDQPRAKNVFGQKFKFRFTSKKTGKKFDLNIFVTNPYIGPAENKKTKGVQDDYSSGKC